MRERLRFSVASPAGIAALDMYCLDVKQSTRLRDVVGASAVGEEAVVADPMEAAGQAVVAPSSHRESGVGSGGLR